MQTTIPTYLLRHTQLQQHMPGTSPPKASAHTTRMRTQLIPLRVYNLYSAHENLGTGVITIKTSLSCLPSPTSQYSSSPEVFPWEEEAVQESILRNLYEINIITIQTNTKESRHDYTTNSNQ